jgi:general secretion pathway protein L
VSLLRIYGSLLDPPQHCQWALLNAGREPVAGEGTLAELPLRAERIQLVVPAAQVLIARSRVPPQARRRSGAVLAFAVEELTAGDPDANQVSWLGSAGDGDALAVVDKPALKRWRDALGAAGIRNPEVHCETLLLPWTADQWSLAWNGREGFARTGAFEGAATDCGDRSAPPLSLRLLLDEAHAQGARPAAIALFTTAADAAPDLNAWTRELGVEVRAAGSWDWRTAPPGAGVSMAQERQGWRAFSGMAARLRTAAWLLGAALAIHAGALIIDWTSLANEQRTLRQQMESRFRATFPDTAAIVDPALQMRRKIAEARRFAGQPDGGDFLPMIGKMSAALNGAPEARLRVLSYESGRITLELAVSDEAAVNRLLARLAQTGLTAERSAAAMRPDGATVAITVRAP